MGLSERLRRLFSSAAKPTGPPAAADALRELSTAAIRLDELGYTMVGDAALCFETTTPEETITELAGVIESVNEAPVRTAGDQYGYRWLVISGADVEDIATGLAFATEEVTAAGHKDALLAAVVGFTNDSTVYLVYSFDRGRYYPFVPQGTSDRDGVEELRLRSLLDEHLPVEPDESEWYPLWPDQPGMHPWETA